MPELVWPGACPFALSVVNHAPLHSFERETTRAPVDYNATQTLLGVAAEGSRTAPREEEHDLNEALDVLEEQDAEEELLDGEIDDE